jgi:hypothetical protein
MALTSISRYKAPDVRLNFILILRCRLGLQARVRNSQRLAALKF